MSPSSIQNEFDRSAGALDAESTLRLIASLPAPEGLEGRVKVRLQSVPSRARIIAWPFTSGEGGRWMQSAGMRAAAAAAIVLVIAGGGWEVYSHIQPAALPTAVSAPQPLNRSGGFNAAGAKRVPQTLDGPVVAAPVMSKEKEPADSNAVLPQKHSKRPAAKKSAGGPAVSR